MKDRARARSILLWFIAIVITVASAAFQRMTGPSYSASGELTINAQVIEYELPRSHETGIDARIALAVSEGYRGILEWQRVNSPDRWQRLLFRREGDSLTTEIPQQPPAGKVRYRILIETPEGARIPLNEEPVIVRFRGAVPPFILIPHIFFMFFSLLFAARTGLQSAVIKIDARRLAVITASLLLVGGLVFGPIVQKYAFAAYWTGWPFGHDLTDNKTAVAFLFWIVALWRGRKAGEGRFWYLLAAIVHFAVYLIPHSLLGSELDYTGSDAS